MHDLGKVLLCHVAKLHHSQVEPPTEDSVGMQAILCRLITPDKRPPEAKIRVPSLESQAISKTSRSVNHKLLQIACAYVVK